MSKYSCYNEQCFAHHKGQCWLLRDTMEYQNKCPFFKTIREYICEEEHRKGEHERLNQQTKNSCHT